MGRSSHLDVPSRCVGEAEEAGTVALSGRSSMKQIASDTPIAATADRVWDVVTDIQRYGEWNPFIIGIDGHPAKGEKLRVHLEPPGGVATAYRARVTTVIPRRELRWRGHLRVAGLLTVEHALRIVENGTSHVTLVQYELFTGILVPLLSVDLEGRIRDGLELMNVALKQRAERRGAGVRKAVAEKVPE
jgi:hypothetical protein